MTKSLKDRGYCVVGIDMATKEWIRLVSTEEGESLPRELLDDQKIKPLDIVIADVFKKCPIRAQKENWLLDITRPLIKTGPRSLSEILRICPNQGGQFVFGNEKEDFTEEEIAKLDHSVELVKVDKLALDTCMKGDGRNHHRLEFVYNGVPYNLALTDPQLRHENLDTFRIKGGVLVVSVPIHPYGENNVFRKFVAKVFPMPF